MTLLRAENLSLSIGNTSILKGVSFDMKAGEILALTGESGSGKSMTALAAMGLLPQNSKTDGLLTFADVNLLETSERALCDLRGRKIGMVFQEPMTALNPVQTIGQQVMETILIHKAMARDAALARTKEILTRVNLPPETYPLSRFPHELSGGQRQRVVIAMAMALRPALLIADEPTTALDVTTQAQILDLLKDLVKEEDMALLMITHDLAVVADMADTLVVMNKGEVVEQGPVKEVIATQKHPYTRALFEASKHQAHLHDTMRGAPILSVKHAVRDYPVSSPKPFAKRTYFRAVNKVTFDIVRGERVGLVGESGCGKSTLTRAILGLEPLQGGAVLFEGHDISEKRANTQAFAKMQVVFQDPYGSFNPRHKVSRLITEPFYGWKDAPKGKNRVDAINDVLTAVGLHPDDQHKHVHAFSGGQRQRLAIARALITQPDLVLFDEAVSALDVRVRAQILDLMADISRTRNLAWLFISHDLHVVRSITDRVMVMKAGEIIEDGPTEQIFENPQHTYTRTLLAAAPVLPDITPNAEEATS